MARPISSRNYNHVSEPIAMWSILDNIFHTLEQNTPESALILQHRAIQPMSIEDFTRALQLTTSH